MDRKKVIGIFLILVVCLMVVSAGDFKKKHSSGKIRIFMDGKIKSLHVFLDSYDLHAKLTGKKK